MWGLWSEIHKKACNTVSANGTVLLNLSTLDF